MALATNSTPGSIVLGGDLTGNANAPELRPSGVVPGVYTTADIVVDAKGRVIAAENGNPTLVGDLTGPIGSNVLSTTGVVAGSYSRANLTIDSKGRVTSATNGTMSFAGDLTGAYDSNILSLTGVTAGNYAYSNLTVDSKGRITAASSGSIVMSGDVVGAYNSNALSTTGVAAGSYTYANLTVDSKGRVSSASNGSTSLSGDLTGPYGTNVLGNTAVTPGSYVFSDVTIDAKGRVTTTPTATVLAGDLTGSPGANALSTTGVVAGAKTVPTLTVASTGRITVATNGSTTLTGDCGGTFSACVLSDTGVVAGTYQAADITVDSKGRLTLAATSAYPMDASYSSKGFLRVTSGTGLTLSTGVLSGTAASGNTTLGVAKSANTNNITFDGSGSLGVGPNVPKIDSANTWLKHARTNGTYSVASSATQHTSVSWSFDTYSAIEVDSTNPGILTINAPSATIDGDEIAFYGVGTTTLSQVSSSGDAPGTIVGGDTIGCVWNGSIFVRNSGAYGTVETSTDGLTWTVRSLPDATARVLDFSWSGSVFVGVGNVGNVDPLKCYIATSIDGVTWTRRTVPNDQNHMVLRHITWNGSRFITTQDAVYPFSYTTYTLYSTDGITWNTGDSLIVDNSSYSTGDLVVNRGSTNLGSLVVCPGSQYNGSVWVHGVATTTTGTSWSFYQVAEFGGTPLTVCNMAGLIVVSDGSAVCTSTNGTTWTYRASLNSVGSLSCVNNLIYVENPDGTGFTDYFSTDGINWVPFLGDGVGSGRSKNLICTIDGVPHSADRKLITVPKVQFDSSYKFSNSVPSTKRAAHCIKYGSTYYCTYQS